MTDWQPIKTAPQDCKILLWNGDVNVGESDSHGGWYAIANGTFLCDGDGDRFSIHRVEDPTHWAHLPEGPPP